MKRQPAPKYAGPTTKGIDVSKWQGLVDYATLAKNSDIKFVIARTGDGQDTDSQFLTNWAMAKANGFLVGSYHYFRADRGGMAQAHLVADLLLLRAGFQAGVDIPPAIDIEDGSWKNLSKGIFDGPGAEIPTAKVMEECLEFLRVLESRLGVRPIVYTGQAFHWKVSQQENSLPLFEHYMQEFSQYPLWIPSYGSSVLLPVDTDGHFMPWTSWTFWQHTSKASYKGVKTEVDGNFFRGSYEDLISFIRYSKLTDSRKESEDTPNLPGQEDVTTLLGALKAGNCVRLSSWDNGTYAKLVPDYTMEANRAFVAKFYRDNTWVPWVPSQEELYQKWEITDPLDIVQ